MLKLLPFLSLLLCLHPAFAALNESTKPTQINVYLEQNMPYSGFNSAANPQGILVDYWQQWSKQSGIRVKYSPYLQQALAPLLRENQPAVYSGLLSEDELENLKNSRLFSLQSQFYYLATRRDAIETSLIENNAVIVVGGLLPQAQKLALFTSNASLIYNEYPGLFELMLDLYYQKIDALVLFSSEQPSSSMLAQFLSLIFSSGEFTFPSNKIMTYASIDQETVLDWIHWGGQSEPVQKQIALAIDKATNPLWGASTEMASKFLVIICLIILFSVFSRSRRKTDRQFKNILDSSPYPLAIFSLDGNTIYYINDEVNALFPFQKKKNCYQFQETENQLLLSSVINKASHQIIIAQKQLRLLVDDSFHDIEISAKRIHYKRKTAWLCYLKDVTALLRAERKLIEERELLRKVLDSIPQQIAFKSPKGTIIGCNDSWATANNTTVANATGRRLSDMVTIDTVNKQKQQEIEVWTGETFNTQEWIQQKNNELSLVNIVKLPLYNNKGSVFAILSIESDITDLYNLNEKLKDENLQRRKTEKALTKQNLLLSTVFSASLDPIGLLNEEGRVIDANKAFIKLMGADADDIIGKLQSEILSPERADWAERQNREVLESGETLIFDEMIFVDGKKICYEVNKTPFKDPTSDYQGIVVIARDITLRKNTEDKLRSDASDFEVKMLHDQLTNLANRRAFDQHFSQLWQEACDEHELLSMVMCDIDFFKDYNDNYGHQKGDLALQNVANALNSICDKTGCFVARYGGEEFAVLIKGGNATKALKVAEQIRVEIKKAKIEHLHSSVDSNVTLSMGLSSMLPSEVNSMKMLLAEADAALYNAKENGRDQICVH